MRILSIAIIWGLFLSSLVAQGDQLPLDDASSYTDSSCQELLAMADGYKFEKNYRASYDTLRSFIEHCYAMHNSWEGFVSANGAVQLLPEGNEKWINYREWLKSVLYLNTVEPMYYCEDVVSILSSFQYKDPKRGYDDNGAAAIIRYILDSKKCEQIANQFKNYYTQGRKAQYEHWQDTVKVDTNLYKLDTTLPSLEEIDLEILRGLSNVKHIPHLPEQFALISLSSSNNPFTSETTLELEVGKLAYIHFEVFNELGQAVIGDGTGKVYEAGTHKFTINGSELSTGIYYARFSTARGEVKTLKLRHVR